MKLMVTGANGQVGWELSRSLAALGQVVALERHQCDMARLDRLPGLVRGLTPDVIVNAASIAADDAEREEVRATKVNGTAVGILAREAARTGALLVHFSCACVFDGQKDTPYTEDDPAHPINACGRSKLAGEIAVRQTGGAHLILRTGWVYSARGRNVLHQILRLLRERDELQIVADQIGQPVSVTEVAHLRKVLAQRRERDELQIAADQTGTPTSANGIAEATAALIGAAMRERANGRFESGLYHVTASGATTWYGFATAVLEEVARHGLVAGADAPRLVPVAQEDLRADSHKALARRSAMPKNLQLAGDRLHHRYSIALPHWKEGLARCVEDEVGVYAV
jgi:dTDP-4-dehydrorhamnose reductase